MEYENIDQIQHLRKELFEKFHALTSDKEAEEFRIAYLGKKGLLKTLMRSVKDMSIEQRKTCGSAIHALNAELEQIFDSQNWKQLKDNEQSTYFDHTLPHGLQGYGSIHPLSTITNEICSIFFSMGFDIAYGPDIESEYYNFQALNFPQHHPARDMQDTFFISDTSLLRTHTSPVQVRVMEKQQPPIRCIMPGLVYRNEEISTRSNCQFYQIEGLYIDENVSIADLKGTLLNFAKQFFYEQAQIKIRPSYFPFTEPSIEIDVGCFLCKGKGCSVCKQSGWLEILGAGMVHPNVLANAGIDTKKYSGFAFGMGIDRIALQKFGINDIRQFYLNDIRMLRQFA